ncbi:calvin cycle protein CP12-2, chloroplastic-like [Lotus japonicus]|uniref:calvin cycle protein CP12-2, chloroplastic-like n=1 Tax=Lotus japonicus TaxID=34305 RepID=UPI00258399C0|nr:calvin cycle protein CP12-2, chloroplastic-like [Lotus japonicus]
MATIAGVSLSSPGVLAKGPDSLQKQKPQAIRFPQLLNQRCPAMVRSGRMVSFQPVRAAPEGISGKVEESIKSAEETCSENATSGECAAAWDEVEELSAAASHARDKLKETDPLENYCKENPETDECRTYDN